MSETTVVHLLRHGEVHNPTGVLYGRLPGFHLSDLGRAMAERVAETSPATTSPTSCRPRWSARRRPPARRRGARARRWRIDERLIEAGNVFEGKTFGVGDGSLHRPRTGCTCATRSARPGASRTSRSPRGCWPRSADARDAARGHEALRRQPPAADLDRAVVRDGRRLWHDPRKRQCALASLTSFTYDGDDLVVGLLRRAGPRPAAGAGGRQEVRRRRLMTPTRSRPVAPPCARRGCSCAAVVLAGCSGSPAPSGVAGPGLRLRRRHRHAGRRGRARRRRSRSRAPRWTAAVRPGRPTAGKVVVVNVWASWCAPCTPRRRRWRRCTEQTPSRGRAVRRHQHARPDRAARALERRFADHLPERRRRRRPGAARASRARCRRPRSRHAGPRPAGPGRRPGARRGRAPARSRGVVDDVLRRAGASASR